MKIRCLLGHDWEKTDSFQTTLSSAVHTVTIKHTCKRCGKVKVVRHSEYGIFREDPVLFDAQLELDDELELLVDELLELLELALLAKEHS